MKQLFGLAILICCALEFTQAAVTPNERILISGSRKEILPINAFQSAEELERSLEKWNEEIFDAALSQSRLIWPKTLKFNFSPRARFNALEAAVKLKRTGFETSRQMANLFSTGQIDMSQSVQSFTYGPLRQSAYDNYGSTAPSDSQILRFMRRLEKLWATYLNDVDLSKARLQAFLNGTEFASQKSLEYQQRFGSDVINSHVIERAAFPLIGAGLLAESYGLSLISPEALTAFSFLFPLTDDGLDRRMLGEASMQKITAVLNGQGVEPSNPHEKIIFELISTILKEFPPDRHPAVVKMLKDLHQAQIEANRIQRDPASSREEILRAEIKKGGLTSALGSYLSVGTLTQSEFEADYKTGALFQLGDDLADYAEDMRLGIQTVWTKGAQNENERVKNGLAIFLNIHRHLEEVFQKGLLDRNARQARINSAALIARGYLFGAYLSDEHPDFFRRILKRKVPLSAANIRRILVAFNREIKSYRNGDPKTVAYFETLVKTLDLHILNGQLERTDHLYAPDVSPKTIYRIASWNPILPFVKLVHSLEEISKKENAGGSLVSLMVAITAGHLFLIHQLNPGLAHDVGSVGMLVFAVTGMAIGKQAVNSPGRIDPASSAKFLMTAIPPWSIYLSCNLILQKLGY